MKSSIHALFRIPGEWSVKPETTWLLGSRGRGIKMMQSPTPPTLELATTLRREIADRFWDTIVVFCPATAGSVFRASTGAEVADVFSGLEQLR